MASYYDKHIKCMWHIADGIIYYPSPNHDRTYSRQMIPEIDRIINTLRPVLWKDGTKRFDKLVYENELVSINRYIIHADKEFTPLPPYPAGSEIVRYHGDVPMTVNGQPVKQPTYYSAEYKAWLREKKKRDDMPDAAKEKRERRLAYLREYARRRYAEHKQNNKHHQQSKTTKL